MLSIHKLPKKVDDRCKYGDAIAVIHSKDSKIDKKYIFLKQDPDYSDDTIKKIEFDKDTKIFPVPLRKTTSRVYVSAPSGAGKSTFSSQWIENYRRIFPDDRVMLISALDQDDVLDKLDYIERIEIGEYLAEMPLQEFENSLVLFDDTFAISNKKVRKAVQTLMNALLERGRHFNASCLITSHLFSNFSETRLVLLEARDIVIFPRFGAKSQARRGLKSYVGIDDKQIDEIFKLKSRWIQIRKSAPQFCLHERGVFLID